MLSELALKKRINAYLRIQGYRVKGGTISLKKHNKDSYRKVQEHTRFLKVQKQLDFLKKHESLVLKHSIDGCNIDVEKIEPKLIEVKSNSKWEILFKWWCLCGGVYHMKDQLVGKCDSLCGINIIRQ